MGIPELLTLIIVFLIFFFAIGGPFILRRKYPNRFWIGTALSFLLGPFGHNYLIKSGWWVFGLIVVFGFLRALLKDNDAAGTITWILSGFLFIYRFRKKELSQNNLNITETEKVS